MKFRMTLAAVAALTATAACAAETHVDRIVRQVLDNVTRIKAADPSAVPMAFWDFDGTVIKGDVSEGLVEDGRQRFQGLIERTIKAGLSTVYPKDGGWETYLRDYERMNAIGRWLSWPYNAQIYVGRDAAELDAFCEAECAAVYRKWYFASSVKMMQALEAAGVENYVVSASPEIFVRNAAASLGLPRSRMRAIRVEISGGRMTPNIVYPVPMGEGKVENVREIVLARPHGVAVAGFGNSYSTDGAFLRYIATQPSLPGGAKGTAVMINGKRPVAGYSEHFILVEQADVVGEPVRVALTFDDGNKDHLLLAAPMLEERGWRGVFNIVTDWIGEGGNGLSWKDVRELIRRGHEVTTHTKSHPSLVKLLSEGKEADVRDQIAGSRDEIEKETGYRPRYMCSPGVHQNAETDRICRELGLQQMNVPRFNFGSNNCDGVTWRINNLIERGERRADLLHHGVAANGHGGWLAFENQESFRRHLDAIAALEKAGKLIVTDYDGVISDCPLTEKDWPRHGRDAR